MMWLLTAWGSVKRLFGAVVAYPWQAALIIALLACLWIYNGREDARMNLANSRDTIEQMEQASKDATAAQIAANKANTDKQTQIARLTDENETNRRDVADRSNDYAGRMRAKDYCREASATPKSDITQGGNSARDTAIVVNADDFRILTDNTARLMDVRAWGQKLIDEGLAENLPGTLPKPTE